MPRMDVQFLHKTVSRKLKLPYYVFLPQSYDPVQSKTWPVVFFLHGAGERGSDLEILARQGLVKQVRQGREFPFILVAPQCRLNWTWDRSLPDLDALLIAVLEQYPVDKSRIYLTGLSMGGYGTWHWAERRPRSFAALVPICGGTMPLMGFPKRIVALKEVPIWVFHGEDDEVVPMKHSVELVDALRQVGSAVRFTQYPGVAHNSWDLAYNEPELISWLLAQQNPAFSLKAALSSHGEFIEDDEGFE